MGAFDDLVPTATTPAKGAFDDLVPVKVGRFVPVHVPGQPDMQIDTSKLRGPTDNTKNEYDPAGSSYFFRPRYENKWTQVPGEQMPLVRNPKDFSEGLYNTAMKGISSVPTPLGIALSGAASVSALRPFVTAALGYLGVKQVASSAGTLAGTPNPTTGQVVENLGDAAQGGLMMLPAAHAAGEAKYAYDAATQLSPGTEPPSTGNYRAPNDIVLDAMQPVAARVPEVTGDQGVEAPAVRLSPGQPYAPGAFDDLVPKEAEVTTRENVEPISAVPLVPLNPGGAKAQGTTLPTAETPIAKEPIKMTAAAVKTDDGQVFTGRMHPDALEKYGKSIGVDTSNEDIFNDLYESVEHGFVDKNGKFYNRSEAEDVTGRPGVAKEQNIANEPKGNLMSEEAAGLRHDLLPLVDEGTRKTIAKYYTDTGDLAGAMKQAHDAWKGQMPLNDGLAAVAKKVADPKAGRLTAEEQQLVNDAAKNNPIQHKKFLEKVAELRRPVPETDSTIGSGIRAALAKNEGSESGFVNLQPVKDVYERLVNSIGSRAPKREILRDKDSADNAAHDAAAKAANGLRTMARGLFGGGYQQTPGGKKVRFTGTSDMALEATSVATEANGNRAKVLDFIKQAQAAGDKDAIARAEFAYVNWDRLQPLVERHDQLNEIQFQRETAAGFNMDKREGYVQHIIDSEKLNTLTTDQRFGSKGGGARGFTKMRYNDTLFDHVEKGNSKAIKTWNAAEIDEHRLKAGLQAVNDAAWVEGMKGMADPSSGRPLVKSMEKQVNPATGTEHLVAPQGYETWSPFPGRSFAVHKGYKAFLDSVTAPSFLRQIEVAGLPVGDWMMKTAGGLKHSMLLFDTFHAVRITVKGLSFGVTGQHSKALLEYNDVDLNQAVANKEITPEMAAFARQNRGLYNQLLKGGLNIGRIAENMDANLWQKMPVAGSFNRFVFEKLTRSVMAEAAIAELKKQTTANPGMSKGEVSAKVAKDMNVYFGNLGRQGLFHSKSVQDLTRLAFLAPQWFESMAQTELRFAGQTAKIPFTGKVGSIARGTGTLLAAMVVATQLGNLITKGQPTWKNDEGHKFDMWIPGEGKGFWFSPLAMPLEITHDAIRYANKGKDANETGMQIMSNKLGPFGRAGVTYWTGKDYSGATLKGSARVKEAARNLIPVPLPVQSYINPNSSMQRQLMASGGFKAEPVEATKAELAAGDVPLESKTLAQRKQLEKQLKTAKEPQSISDRRVMLERGAQSEATRNEAVLAGLPSPAQKWLTDKGLQLPSYQDTLQMGSTRLSLTKKEEDFLQEKVVSEYTRVVSGLMENPTFQSLSRQQQQNRLNNLMTQARGRVRVQLRKQMASQRMLLSGSLQP